MLDVRGRKHTLNESFILAPPIFDRGGSETIVVRLKLSKGIFLNVSSLGVDPVVRE
jgi:hypothetical protein